MAGLSPICRIAICEIIGAHYYGVLFAVFPDSFVSNQKLLE